MNAAWVAGAVRARALTRRRVGRIGARSLADGSLQEAVAVLARSPYGRYVRAEMSLPAAQHAVTATSLWHVRVLAGWLPSPGTRMLRALAGWFELENIKDRVLTLMGLSGHGGFEMGRLRTAWDRLATTGSIEELRAVLATSPWRDPGSSALADLHPSLILSWVRRVAYEVPAAAGWARSQALLVVARERFLSHRELTPPAHSDARTLLGGRWTDASSLTDLVALVPSDAAWVVRGIDDPRELWRAEAQWWSRVADEGERMCRSVQGPGAVIGTVGLLLADAWRVRAALEIASHGGDGKTFDVVA